MRQRVTTPEFIFQLCSLLLAAVAITRATSYAARPPDITTSAAAAAIEAGIGYDRWVWVLAFAAVFIVAGTLTPAWPLRFLGHLLGLFSYSIFALSIIYAAVSEGAGWTSAGALTYVAAAHAAVVIFLGLTHGRH